MTKKVQSLRHESEIYVQLRNGHARYGLKSDKSDASPSLKQISAVTVSHLLNSRIDRRRYSPIVRNVCLVLALMGTLFMVLVVSSNNQLLFVSALLVMLSILIYFSTYATESLEKKGRTTTLNFKLDSKSKESYKNLLGKIAGANQSLRIWSVQDKMETADWKRNAGASGVVNRKVAEVKKRTPPFIASDTSTISISYGQDGWLSFFPDQLYDYKDGAYHLVDYGECKPEVTKTRFVEEEDVPSDAKQIDSTWRFVRKDGVSSPKSMYHVKLEFSDYAYWQRHQV